MNRISCEDLFKFNFLSGLTISPDGQKAVFLNQKADEKENTYKSYIHILKKDGSIRELTYTGRDKKPLWLDNETILFPSKREDGNKEETAFYSLSLKGGEAKKEFSIPLKISSIEKIKGSKFLITASSKCSEEEKKDFSAEEGKDFYIFDEIYFWKNGSGVTNKIRTALFIYDSSDGTYSKITDKYTEVSGFSISEDRKNILFTGNTFRDMYTAKGGLYLYNVDDGKTKTIIPEGKYNCDDVVFMGNEKAFFTLFTCDFNGQNPKICILDVKSGKYKIMEQLDFSIGGDVGTDISYGPGKNKKYYGGKMYITRPAFNRSELISMDENGNTEVMTDVPGSVIDFDIEGSTALMIALRDNSLAEIYALDLVTKKEKKISSFNDEYHREHFASRPEYFTFKNRDGIELDGFVLKPYNYVKGKKYPGVLEMHGGPKVIFGHVFHHEMQVLASKGYFVFFTNPRGSDGRGSQFANLVGKLGKIDFNDFMDFTDEVIRRYPDLDEKKIGICGGSYGGFMCNWMVGHTDRFAAAASQRSISNYLTKSLTTDIGYYHNMQQLEGTPWTNFDSVWKTSPLESAFNAKTPTLFIQSDEDYRCWMSDALQMYSALKMSGTDARIALFHKEHHGLSRVGRPLNRIARLSEICSWFDKYLK